jgi:surface antigen
MLTAHQVVGYATLAGMLAQGIIGGKLYNGDTRLRDTHETLGNIVTAMYFTDAGLSLFAPPPLVNKKVKGWSSMKAHKALATIHLSAMIATQMLADENKKAHRAAAYTAFGAYAAAAVVMKF